MKKILLSIFVLFTFGPLAMAQKPNITSISQTTGPIGTALTLTGSNFNPTPSNNLVFFGQVATTPTVASATSLTVNVPSGASYGKISILNTQTGLMASSDQCFNPTFSPSKGSITPDDFAAKQDFGTGNSPQSLAMGDLDGDGKPDLAIANYDSHTVSVLINNSLPGSPNFVNKQDFATGQNPHAVAIADLDGDGKPELAVTSTFSGGLSILRNISTLGSANFAPKQDFVTDIVAFSLAIGDLDGDGKPDLALTNYVTSSNEGAIVILRNTSTVGNLNFVDRQDFGTNEYAYAVAIGDLDSDRKPDLATSSELTATVSVLLNTSSDGNPNFAPKQNFGIDYNPLYVAIGDLDGDGKPDLVVANYGSASISILRNTSSLGSLAFASKEDFNVGATPISIAMGDLDGDGKPDLAIANLFSNEVSVLRNLSTMGSLTFAPKQALPTGNNTTSVAIGDVDGDGKPDVVASIYNSNTVAVLRNNPQFTTLPVNFGKLTTTVQNNRVKLAWNTFSESNNQNFTVYRSTDGVNYSQIAQHTSKGNGANDYVSYDNSPANGLNYYRLSQQDHNGTISKLADGVIDYSLGSAAVQAWPNPVDKWLKISFTAGKYQTLSLTDATGKKLEAQNLSAGQSQAELDMSAYPKGIYMVELKGTPESKTIKILK